ncbi:MAG: FAD-dependent oxidoreductase [Alphaproteobacteria bacterium]
MNSFDVAVVGGGMVGSAIAYGLARRRLSVVMLDEGDVAFRAARGNFGLVWVQGKGANMPAYAALTRRSSDAWPAFADELAKATGVELEHRRAGGVDICFDDESLTARQAMLSRMDRETDGGFPFEILDHAALANLLPGLGPKVAGGSYCPIDGDANPLHLLRALHAGFIGLGGDYRAEHRVRAITPEAGGFTVNGDGRAVTAGKVVLAAGLGNADLAPGLGLRAPVAPQRGQILVSERLAPVLPLPTGIVRQTGAGSMQFGDSVEEVGFDDGTTSAVMGVIAHRAVTAFPYLRDVRVVRAWGALRVMTPDGHPVYQQSATHPGAYVACCHSGVTLAAGHATEIADWIAGDSPPANFDALSPDRFDV